jgi:hypothetical protein
MILQTNKFWLVPFLVWRCNYVKKRTVFLLTFVKIV